MSHGNAAAVLPPNPSAFDSDPHLTGTERAVYETLLHADHPGHRRIEQERIPLNEALTTLGCAVRVAAPADV